MHLGLYFDTYEDKLSPFIPNMPLTVCDGPRPSLDDPGSTWCHEEHPAPPPPPGIVPDGEAITHLGGR